MEGILISIAFFGVVFGIFYLHYSTRNKERLALIEKGADASIFYTPKNKKAAPVWKILILNTSVLLMGIGIGVFLANILNQYAGLEEEVAYPGSIFLVAGIALFIGFKMTQQIVDKEKKQLITSFNKKAPKLGAFFISTFEFYSKSVSIFI